MARILKHADAPEGDLKVSVGTTSFRVKDGEPTDVEDLAVVEALLASYPGLFEVEYDDTPDLDPKAEARALNELHKEQEKAKAQHVTKDVMEPAAPIPTSLADLNEIKAQRDDDKAGKD